MPITDKTTLTLTMRPNEFDEVIGLEGPIRSVKAKIASGSVPRAFLIKGPYGTGKTTLAHIIAKYIQGPLFEGRPEIQEVNAANYRKLEHMRALADTCGSYPMLGTYSVIILDECHKLTGDSQDVLLKELEVPKSPTVWILATTDPDKLNQGVRDRCFTLTTEGMTPASVHELVKRAVAATAYEGDVATFEALVNKHRLTSPRKILMAFDMMCSGTPAEAAVGALAIVATPEYHEIAFAVCFGKWDAETTMFGGNVTVQPVSKLLKDLDDKLKKKPAADSNTEESETALDDDDVVDNKPEAARVLSAVVGAFLKGRVLPKIQKGNKYKYPQQADCERAFAAMQVLAGFIPTDRFELQWSGIMLVLWRVNQRMQGK